MNYTKEEILNASAISLLHRGMGTGPDADAGWEKVWRAAAWAQLADETEFYKTLTVRVGMIFHLLKLTRFSTRSREILRQISLTYTQVAGLYSRLMQTWDIPLPFW